MDIEFDASVLLASSAPATVQAVREALGAGTRLQVAASGAAALAPMQQTPRPDVVLVDAALGDAWILIHELKSNFLSAEVPLLVLAGPGDTARALAEGAADVVALPSDPQLLRARTSLLAELRRARQMLRDQSRHVELLVAERTRALVQMQDATILALGVLGEVHEENVHNHLLRTQHFVGAIARELRFRSGFEDQLTTENITIMTKAVALHDIGKAAVPEAILLKPGKLTSEEFNVMKAHTIYGRDAIAGVEQTLGFSTPFLRYAGEIAHGHHEHWDGTGYPQGQRGAAIPLSARLMAVADVYDALISHRRYRPAFTHETAIELIRQGRGEHFDPDVVDAMLAIEERILAIANEFADPPHAPE